MRHWKSIVVFVFLFVLSAPAARGGGMPGRILVTPRPDIILACNLDGSNCFHVTGAVQSAGDPPNPSGDQDVSFAYNPSVANNGTIAFQAAFTPAGSCAGLGNQGFCVSHVFVADADGTSVDEITFNPPYDPSAFCYGGDFAAAISPDGSMVAFVSARNCAYDANKTPYAHAAVFVVNVDGSNLRQVTPFFYDSNGSPHGDMYAVAWSPDSTKLAFKASAYGTACGTYNGSPIDFLGVGTINVDGTALAWIACDSVNAAGGAVGIDWSPDGTLIADARDSVHFGEPAIRFTQPNGTAAGGLTLAQLGVQYGGGSFSGEFCVVGGSPHCFHFSPDSMQIAYVNDSPTNNPSFTGISTIKLDGTGRTDSFNFGTLYSGYGLENRGMWWAPGPALPPAAQLTLAPSTVEVWPGFSQQLIPSLFDASGNLISHTARAFRISYYTYHSCAIEIGPYGLPAYKSGGPDSVLSTLAADNAGLPGSAALTSSSVPLKCWTAPPCTYALSNSSDNIPLSGGSDSVTVIATPYPGNDSTCPWNAESNDPWIRITSPFLGVGAGTNSVSFTVDADTGDVRQGTLTIAGQTFMVNQAPVAPPSVDLSITKTGSADTVTVGGNVTFTITATNNGPDAATGVTVNDTLPAGMTFVSASASQGSCSTSSPVSCSLGTLANGAHATVTIVVNTTQTGVIGNTATAAGNEADPNTANNTATAMTTVNPPARMLTSLSPAKLWIGQNGSLRKLKYDVLAEVLVNDNVVGSGRVSGVKAGSATFSKAVLDTLGFALLAGPTPAPTGATLALRVSVRVSCTKATTETSSTARLWYNGRAIDSGTAKDAGSRFDATIGGTNSNYFLVLPSALATAAGTSRQFVDVAVNDSSPCPARAFTPFGTWSMTLP